MKTDNNKNKKKHSLDGIYTDRPNAARIYDYFLGGYHNFEIDRKYAEASKKAYSDVSKAAKANRLFIHRSIKVMIDQGIEQFLDIGSGIPTVGNTHETAQNLNSNARIVYVDIDPVAVQHSNSILQENSNAVAIIGDLTKPEDIFNNHEVVEMLDLDQPIGVIMVAVLHFIPDTQLANNSIAKIRDTIVSGSYISIAQTTYDKAPQDLIDQFNFIAKSSSTPFTSRPYEEILGFFAGFELIEPGLVFLPLWHPTGPNDPFYDHPERSIEYAGVAFKP